MPAARAAAAQDAVFRAAFILGAGRHTGYIPRPLLSEGYS